MVTGMPRKIRDLIHDLREAGFQDTSGGKGSHRKFIHPRVKGFALIPGKEGDDAKPYLERHVRQKLQEAKP